MKRALSINDLFNVERPIQVLISHNGTSAWLATKRFNLAEDTSSLHAVHIDLAARQPRAVDLHKDGAADLALTDDDKMLFFVADGQVWTADGNGANPRQVTHGAGGASCPVPSKNGDRVLFARSVYMNKAAQDEFEKTGKAPSMAVTYGLSHPKACARTTDALMYRHWDKWTENKRSHLFIADTETGEIRDLTPEDADVPPIALESVQDYDFSPDGRHIVYAKNPDKVVARSTNNSIYLADIDGLNISNVRRISDTDGSDTGPRFLSDTKIAYLSLLTPGYESDASRLKIYDAATGKTRLYLESFERSIDSFSAVDDKKLLFKAQNFAHESLFTLDLDTGTVEQLTSGRTYTKFAAARGMKRVLALVEALESPAELVELTDLKPFAPKLAMGEETVSGETVTPLTDFGSVLSDVEMHPGKRLCYDYKGTTLEGYIVTPPGFDPAEKYPFILLIHGGPQGAFLDSFHYRWSVEMFAAQGAIVGFCNPHGSTGYGHALTRAISKHWSEDCPAAIMKFVDAACAEMPQIDPERMAAAGASFGGFMINWLLGHTDRFKALVSHDGIFNTEMSGYLTDELWFSDYEFGAAPYEAPECYLRHSPHHSVDHFKTPTLVIQGEQDFRCFISEGVALFTALQYKGVESRLLYFPNEGHWVLDPADAAVWYEEVVGWMMRHIA